MKNKLSAQDLQHKITELPQEISPERDLWSGIERAIQITPQPSIKTSRFLPIDRPFAWAASVIAAVLLTWGVFAPIPQSSQPSLSLVSQLQQNFEAQKSAMLVSFGEPKVTELPIEMQEQLHQLASARLAIENALLADPNNSDLLNLLNWTQQQEINFIKQLYSPQWQTI